jgi:uncharacterized membrane protein YeaQ/YmgE (transglycosylase-associated protein family)
MSTHLTNPAGHSEAASEPDTRVRPIRTPLPDDGTRQLLQGAFWTLLTGIIAAFCTRFLFGGIGIHGPHTNAGWIALIVSMMCLPFGCMLLLLGGAKYFRNRRLARKVPAD